MFFLFNETILSDIIIDINDATSTHIIHNNYNKNTI